MKIYVGNLSYQTNDASLRDAFAEFGEVAEVAVVTDRDTGRSRGFGFVTMPDDEAARSAIAALNGQRVDGRPLNVSEAQSRGDRGGGGGGERRGGGGGGYGGGGGRSGGGGGYGGGGGGGRGRW